VLDVLEHWAASTKNDRRNEDPVFIDQAESDESRSQIGAAK
jgi:hypothetical protein